MKIGNLPWLLAGAVVLAACSDAPNGPDPEPVTFTFYASHDRITTPGHITFTASSDKPLTRVEVYESGQKVGESVGPNDLHTVEIVVTRASNGARTYVAKGYDAAGTVRTSDPVAVDVDIRWDSFRVLEGGGGLRVVFDATGAMYSAGGTGAPQPDILLTKHDVNGRQLWRRTFGGPGWEGAASIGVDPSGRVHVAGSIYYPETQKSDCFLVVYDASGNIAWAQQGATPFSESSCAAASDAAGNFYLAGLLASSPTRATLFLAKFDANGNLVWVREHERAPGEKSPVPSSVAVDPLGAVYVCGYVWVMGPPWADGFVMKFNPEGNRLWTREYGAADSDYPTGLTPDPDGGVYIAGVTERPSYGPEAFNAFLVRFAPDGTLVWDRVLDGGKTDVANGVAAEGSGVFLVGYTEAGIRTSDFSEPRQGPYDAFLAKLSRSGEVLWVRLLGGRNGEGGWTGANGTNGLGLGLGTNGDVSILVTTRSLATVPEGGFVLARHRDLTP